MKGFMEIMCVQNENIHKLIERLFPICRSITGNGVRETLKILKEYVPELKMFEVPSGTKVFDWVVPREWNIREAYIEDSKGNRIIDFKKCNLHVVGYSLPVDKRLSLEELKKMVYVYEADWDAVPYITSYYSEKSAFCMSKNQLESLQEDIYHVYIDSDLKEGSLTYGEIILPGESEQEILFSTYVCHPQMANNELSGPAVAVYLAKWLKGIHHKYTYRFIFVPETIGSITYISKNIDVLKKNVIAGFNLSCLGDDNTYTYVATRKGDTLSDKIVQNILNEIYPQYKKYSFLNRGSDERQYNMPGVDIPVCGIYRSKSNEYKEYHTSKDDLSFVTEKALQESLDFLKKCVETIEANKTYRIKCLCEPQLGKRGLYPTIGQRGSSKKSGAWKIVDFLAYADGEKDLIDISNTINVPVSTLHDMANILIKNDLLEIVEKRR